MVNQNTLPVITMIICMFLPYSSEGAYRMRAQNTSQASHGKNSIGYAEYL
jgi:hypothetical protein